MEDECEFQPVEGPSHGEYLITVCTDCWNRLARRTGRQMAWGDIVPLGHFPTWACEPNPSLAELRGVVSSLQSDRGTEHE